MKRSLFATLIISLFLVSCAAEAQNRPRRQQPPPNCPMRQGDSMDGQMAGQQCPMMQQRMGMGQGMGRRAAMGHCPMMIMRPLLMAPQEFYLNLQDELDLKDSQIAKLNRLRQQSDKLGEEARQVPLTLYSSLKDGDFNRAEELTRTLQNMPMELLRRRIQLAQEASNVLTRDQRQQLEQLGQVNYFLGTLESPTPMQQQGQ